MFTILMAVKDLLGEYSDLYYNIIIFIILLILFRSYLDLLIL